MRLERDLEPGSLRGGGLVNDMRTVQAEGQSGLIHGWPHALHGALNLLDGLKRQLLHSCGNGVWWCGEPLADKEASR